MDKNLFQIVKNYGYKSLSIIFALILVNSILELMVIGSIIPFAAVIVDPENIENINIINFIYKKLNFQNDENFIIFLGIVFFNTPGCFSGWWLALDFAQNGPFLYLPSPIWVLQTRPNRLRTHTHQSPCLLSRH